MKVPLRDGQWADLRERINHSEDKRLSRLARASKASDDPLDWQTELVRAFVRAWSVNDVDGQPIDIADSDAIERAPADIIDLLWEQASDAYTGATVPNASTEKPSSS